MSEKIYGWVLEELSDEEKTDRGIPLLKIRPDPLTGIESIDEMDLEELATFIDDVHGEDVMDLVESGSECLSRARDLVKKMSKLSNALRNYEEHCCGQ